MANKIFISTVKHGEAELQFIHSPDTKLVIGVVPLPQQQFNPLKGEVHYYANGTDGKSALAFQTQGYRTKVHKTLLILEMIAAYCLYLGFADAQISATLCA